MLFHPQLLAVAGFTGLMAIAAFEDLRRFIIPNTVIVGLCTLWVLYFSTAPSATLVGGLAAVACGLGVLLAGAVLFSRGLFGGGDVKLIAAAALWAGPNATLPLLALTGLLGGVLTLLLLSPVGAYCAGTLRSASSTNVAATPAPPAAIPYGVAIAAAALIVTLPPIFSP
jgi:prepilin peptidase CpaA